MTGKVGRFVSLIILLAMFTGVPSVHAQGTARISIENINNGLFPHLEAYASVTNTQGFPLKNLGISDFSISEDNQPISDFEVLPIQNTKQALAIALVIDTSGSMRTTASPTPLEGAVNSAKVFVNSLSPQDQVAVVGFSDTPTVVQEFTDDKNLVKTKLDLLDARGNTALYDAIVQAVGLLKNRSERRILVLITDGVDSSIGKFDFKTAMDETTRWNIPVYPIGFGAVDQKELEQIAILTGGLAQIKPDSSDIQSSFNVVLQALREQYLIRYTSKLSADGKTHSLQVSVQGQSATQTYIALPGEITIKLPFEEGQVVGGNILLEPEVLAPAPIAEMELLLDGSPLQTIRAEPFKYAWDSTSVAPGPHQFTFKLKDSAGNTAQKILNLTIQPPITVRIVTPSRDQELGGESKVTVDVQSLAAVARVEYTIDKVLIQTINRPPYELNVDWDKYSKGTHLLEVRATDVNGFSDTQEIEVQAQGTGDIWFLILVLGIALAALGIPIGLRWRRKPTDAITKAGQAILRQIEGSNAGQTWTLDVQDMGVGRRRGNFIQLKSTKASREHATIRYEDGQYVLYNLREENPPLVNNVEVREKRILQPNDVIQFGEDVLRYEQQ